MPDAPSRSRRSPAKRSTRRPRAALQAVTLDDVAAAAGVSRMTVSRVLRGGFSVSAKLQDRVQKAVRDLDYRLNTAARALAGSGPSRLGFVYSNPSQAYLSELLAGALAEANILGLQLTLTADASTTDVTSEIKALLKSGVRLLFLPSPACDNEEVLRLLQRADAQWVAISPSNPEAHRWSVSADHYEIAREMTRRLIALKHRCIGFIAGPPNSKGGAERLRGHLDAASEARLASCPVEQGWHTFQSGLDATERLLTHSPACTAIVASNDDMAAAAIFVAHRHGLKVPHDLTIVGFDDTPIASIIYPTLTTAKQPIADMARAAIQLLHAASVGGIRGGHSIQKVLRYSIIERQSSAPCSGSPE